MPWKYGKWIVAAILALAAYTAFNMFGNVAHACGRTPEVACGLTAQNKHFSGTVKLVNPIRVTVCHSYWNQLKVGRLNGRATRWWGPTIRKGGWSHDLPAASSQCKTWWVKPGTSIDTFASCVNKVVSTGAMLRPDTYWLY